MTFYRSKYRKFYASAPATAFAHNGAGSNIVYGDPEIEASLPGGIERNSMNLLIEKVLCTGISK
ncbi:hypothetical protein [Niastella populi]|uniref:Uncharacterized protein n=1 Tax=Niastella populi TaxID=550983 RepID=A0A1V9G1S6_9BACT|nr:hypothetical protein [Niastella populi]OQP64514.1 hypothetical protein A4R26_15795 [Niastella populi]